MWDEGDNRGQEVRFKDGGTLRIGTDDAEGLVGFLNGKIGEQGT